MAFAQDLGLQSQRYGQRAKSLAVRRQDEGLLEEMFGMVQQNPATLSLRWFYAVEHVSCVIALVEAGVGCAIVPALSLVPRHDAHIVPRASLEARSRAPWVSCAIAH